MNAKVAKRLRREANYHPSIPRKYMITKKGTIWLDEADPRTLYKELKKDLHRMAW